MAIRAVSNLYNHLFPHLGTLSTQQLKLRQKVATAVTFAFASTSLWCMKTLYEQSKSPSTDISGMAKNVAAGLGLFCSFSAAAFMGNHLSDIDLALDPRAESLDRLHFLGLIPRVDRDILRKKFDDVLETRPPPGDGEHIAFFINLSKRYGLKELVLQGVVDFDECSYQKFDIDPVSIGANWVEFLFPLRSSAFTPEEWEQLSSTQRRQSKAQEAQYRQFLEISNNYPNRQWDFSVHNGRGWSSQAKAIATRQQKDFEKEIRALFHED